MIRTEAKNRLDLLWVEGQFKYALALNGGNDLEERPV